MPCKPRPYYDKYKKARQNILKNIELYKTFFQTLIEEAEKENINQAQFAAQIGGIYYEILQKAKYDKHDLRGLDLFITDNKLLAALEETLERIPILISNLIKTLYLICSLEQGPPCIPGPLDDATADIIIALQKLGFEFKEFKRFFSYGQIYGFQCQSLIIERDGKTCKIFYFIEDIPLSFLGAHQYCYDRGLALLPMRNRAEHDQILSHIQKNFPDMT